MKKYTIEFDVTGSWPFPVDMLRYDRCTPSTEGDSHVIMQTIRHDSADIVDGTPRVRVLAQGKPRNWTPTHGRWESFGWRVDLRSFTTREDGTS